MEVKLTSDFRDFLCLVYKYLPPPQLVSYWICAAFSGVPDRQSRWNGVPEKTSEISDQSNTTAATEDHRTEISSYQPWSSSYGSGKGDIVRWLSTADLNRPTLGARDFSSAVSGFCQLRPTAEDVSAFGQHRKFPPHARKTSGTQGKTVPENSRLVERVAVSYSCAFRVVI